MGKVVIGATALDTATKERIAALRLHPSWGDLKELFEARFERACFRNGSNLLSGSELVDQRRVEFERGYWRAVRDILDTPLRAEKAYARDLEELEPVE